MTYIELCQDEARKHGIELSAEDADHVLWVHTGFPAFFAPKEGETLEDVLRRQVGEWCATKGNAPEPTKAATGEGA